MNKIIQKVSIALVIAIVIAPFSASAHRSGCHRWHSCPSDTGSYVCGDLGYTSGCPTVKTEPTYDYRTIPTTTKTITTAPTTATVNDYFVGIPKTRADLNNCLVVGNYSSYIYHTKGSKFIKGMVLKNKECFATETDAKNAGFRKSKTR